MTRKVELIATFTAVLLLGIVTVAWLSLPEKRVYIPPRYFDVETAPHEPLYRIQIGGRVGCVNRSAKIVIEPQFDDVECSSDKLIPFEKDGIWGYLNQLGDVVLEPQFSLGRYGYSNNFSSGLAVVCQNEKCGYIDESGRYAIPPIFDWAGHFHEGFAIARIGAEKIFGWEYKAPSTIMINTKGERVFGESDIIPNEDFSDGVAAVIREGRRAFIDSSGNILFFTDEKGAATFTEGLAAFGTRDLYRFGYIDKTGAIAVPQQFKQAGRFAEGLAPVMFENGKYGFIERTGKTVVEPTFDVADQFYEGRASARIGLMSGYIDRTGSLVIPLQFGSAERFKDGMAKVSFDDQNPPYETKKYGYIDLDGKFVIEPTN